MARDFPPAHYRRRRGIVWPTLLVAAGVVFLLQNFGILTWSAWGSLWRLWPLILILVGLDLVLGGLVRGPIAAVGLPLAVLVIVGGAIFLSVAGHFTGPDLGSTSGTSYAVSRTFTQALEGASQANVTLQFGAGNLSVAALAGQTDQLASTSYQGTSRQAPRPSYSVRDGAGQLLVGPGSGSHSGFRPPFFDGSGNAQLDVRLNPSVPLGLTIQEGASTGRIDLTKLHVTSLDLQTGASQTTLLLPSSAGTTTAAIKGGAATLDIQVPPGVAAQIQYDGGLSTLNVDQSRFPSAGGRLYRSADYGAAANKIDLTISAGVATVNVH